MILLFYNTYIESLSHFLDSYFSYIISYFHHNFLEFNLNLFIARN